MFLRGSVCFTLALAVVAAVQPAFAASTSATMTVTATVISTCTIASGNLAFGNYDAIGANASTDLLGTAQVTATCSKGATAQVDIDPGLNPSGTGNAQTRRMKGPGTSDFLTYDIYKDSARNQRWGTKTGGTTATVIGTGATPISLTAYGSVPSGQQVQVGAYSDSVAVTINY